MKWTHVAFIALSSLMLSSSAALADYPKSVKKQLYAGNDLRGKELPTLEVEQWINGKTPETAGKVVLIDLWATWCGDCRRAIPELNSFQEKFGKDLVIIGLSDEPVEKLKPFLSTNDVKYLIGTDTKKTLKSFLKVKGIPHIVILTPDNVVRWQGPPGDPSDLLTEDLVAGIIETSKEKMPMPRNSQCTFKTKHRMKLRPQPVKRKNQKHQTIKINLTRTFSALTMSSGTNYVVWHVAMPFCRDFYEALSSSLMNAQQ